MKFIIKNSLYPVAVAFYVVLVQMAVKEISDKTQSNGYCTV